MKTIDVAAAVFHQASQLGLRLAFFRRAAHENGAGFWEFPGGKIEDGESPEQALVREIQEELQTEIRVQEKLGEVLHQYPLIRIRLKAFYVEPLAQWSQVQFKLIDHDQFAWRLESEVNLLEVSEADRPLVGLAYRVLKNRPLV